MNKGTFKIWKFWHYVDDYAMGKFFSVLSMEYHYFLQAVQVTVQTTFLRYLCRNQGKENEV